MRTGVLPTIMRPATRLLARSKLVDPTINENSDVDEIFNRRVTGGTRPATLRLPGGFYKPEYVRLNTLLRGMERIIESKTLLGKDR